MSDAITSAQAPDDFWVTRNKDLMIGGSHGYAWSPKAKSMSGVHGRLRFGIFLYMALQSAVILILIAMMYVMWTFQSDSGFDGPLTGSLGMIVAAGGLYLPTVSVVTMAICVILYSLFVYRGMRNLYLSDARAVDTSPGWAVGWSFIPFANLRMIHNVMKQIWVGSHDPVTGKYDPPITLNLWWGCWIGSGVIGRISDAIAPKTSDLTYLEPSEYLSAFLPTSLIGIFSGALSVVSCFCLMAIIKQITTAQETLRSTSAFDE